MPISVHGVCGLRSLAVSGAVTLHCAVRGSLTLHGVRPVGLQGFGRPAVGGCGEVGRPPQPARSTVSAHGVCRLRLILTEGCGTEMDSVLDGLANHPTWGGVKSVSWLVVLSGFRWFRHGR